MFKKMNQEQNQKKVMNQEQIAIPVAKDFNAISFRYDDEMITIIGYKNEDNITYSHFNIVGDSFKTISEKERYIIIHKKINNMINESTEKSLLLEYVKTLIFNEEITINMRNDSFKLELNRFAYNFFVKKYNAIKSEKKVLEKSILNMVKNIGNGLLKQDIMINSDSDFFAETIESGDFSISAKNKQYTLNTYCRLINEFFRYGKIVSDKKTWFIKGISYKLKKSHSCETSEKFITFQDISSFRDKIAKHFEIPKNQFESYIDFSEIQIKIGKNIETIKIK